MKKATKFVALGVSACMLVGTFGVFVGCGEKGGKGGEFYLAETLSTMEDTAKDYNSNLFYVNSLEFGVADPSVIYVTEGKGQGWFYAYGTSDEIGGHGFQTWRSKDLAHWEARGIALYPDYEKTWAVDNYWAPEVIYDAEVQKYYIFYNAFNQNDNNRLCLSVAQSDSPEGPFETPTMRNLDGKQISPEAPVIDLTRGNTAIPAGLHKDHALDASPFIDPETGKKYLYFGYYADGGDGTWLYGMEMKDWFTPDYSTLTVLTRPGYSSLAQAETGIRDRNSESHINEGPHMMYHNGKYYLTFSVNAYQQPSYRVIQAIADDPLGTYIKVAEDDGGKVISTDLLWGHIASAGHHAFIKVGDETFIAYHTFLDRLSISGGRALAVDKIVWTTNSEGTEVMHTNGPTWSMQPLPEAISGYKNIAPSATITSTAQGGDLALLNDELVKYQEKDCVEEFYADKGEYTFTLKWDSPKTARAIMVYNSYDYFASFDAVKRIEIDYLNSKGEKKTATIKDVKYDDAWFLEEEFEFLRPGGSAIVEFNELPVSEIRITVGSREAAQDFGLSEIVVLGKDAPCAGVDKLTGYEYRNMEYASEHIITESKTFGTVMVDGEPSALQTMYGYDLSHDDGTQNAYIEQTGVRDQFAYFKDVYSTSFYVEAEFTVPVDDAFAKDEYPKFGIAVSCDDEVTSTMFYYIDAQDHYTMGQVGCAPRSLSGEDWDWTNENLRPVDITYKNGAKTKLAIIRQGATFYFLCNDQLVMQSDSFVLFGEDQRAAVGFLSFNTPMIISNYSATADEAVVSAKLAQYVK